MAASVSLTFTGSMGSVKSALLEAVMTVFHSLVFRFADGMRCTLLSRSDVSAHKDFSGSTGRARHVLQDLITTPHIRCVFRCARTIKFTILCLKNVYVEMDSS